MILSTTDEILGALERGDLSKDLAQSIRNVLQALVDADGGKGGVTLKLKITAKGEMVSFKADIVEQLPPKERRTSTFFVTGDGRLSLQHPDQVEMFRSGDRRRDATDLTPAHRA
ncbi:hypothetical protein ME121_3237 [Methylobacterium sp. ME121]|nr:hypothetical protein ADL19_06580 [Streptomyces purpurogeneiscleroticus]GAN49212.1 hypothetical protein ME121_3237 [Methylobacterium sp. ME121]